MYAFQADSREMVDAAHAAALEGGATCEGKPGNRTKTLYMAYFRDPEGNKLGVFHMESPEMFARDAQELSGAMLG